MTMARSIRRSLNSLQRVEFVVRVGVEDPKLRGSAVIGRWRKQLEVLAGPRAIGLGDEFANWPVSALEPEQGFPPFGEWVNRPVGVLGPVKKLADRPGGIFEAREILRFTQLYCPLDLTPEPGAEFRFEVYTWPIRQQEFRSYWEALGRQGAPKHWESAPERRLSFAETLARNIHPLRPEVEDANKEQIQEEFRKLRNSWPGLELAKAIWFSGQEMPDGEFLARSQGRLVYGAGNLWRFLLLLLFSSPAERLRRCHKPDCKSPYFVARHLNQNFCSDACARWGQRRHTLAWWNKKGKLEREKKLREARRQRRIKRRREYAQKGK